MEVQEKKYLMITVSFSQKLHKRLVSESWVPIVYFNFVFDLQIFGDTRT